MHRPSLVRKLVLLVAAAVSAGMVVSSALAVWQEIERYGAARRQLLLATAHIFASAAASSVVELKQQETLEAIRAVGQIPGFLFVQVKTRDGRVLAAFGGAPHLAGDALVSSENSASVLGLLRSGTVLVSAPVINGGEEVGRIRLISDTADLWPHLLSTLVLTLLGSAVALAIGLFVAWQFQRAITRPLRLLVGAMEHVRRDHSYDVRVEAASDREIGLLVDGFNAMLDDIRDRDRRLTAYRETLEQKVVDRTRDLAIARDAAEQANHAKSDFLATMSHEIRTPMNGIMVMADLLVSASMPRRLHRYADVIATSGRSLLAIINDILDFSKIEAGKLELESGRIHLDEVVENVLSLFAERAQARNVDLAAIVDPDVPRTIAGDSVRLSQVVGNLINNALKFTETGFVRLAVGKSADPRWIELAVEDTGIGIPEDKLATVFESFSQADQSTTRKYGGTGLGLAICRRIVTAMGGTIEVSSTVGVGSTFRVRIPADETETHPWPRLAGTGADQPICLIDAAGEATVAALATYLNAFGYSVVIAGPGTSMADCASISMLWADVDRLHPDALPGWSGEHPLIVAIARFGDESADAFIGNGRACAVISRPLLRSEIEGLLRRVVAGETLLHSRQAARGHHGQLPTFPNLRVLVADDNAVNREVAIEALARLGAQVVTVENGLEAVKAAAALAYDIILMDGSMPDMDGFAAARAIRQAEQAADRAAVPIIALTAHVVGAAADEWRRSGMNGIIHKPFTIAQLARCLMENLPHLQLSPGEAAMAAVDTGAVGACTEESSGAASDNDGLPLLEAGILEQLKMLRTARNDDFFNRVVSLYREHAPAACVQIVEHAEAGDTEAVGSVAHSLKSMSLNIGAAWVARIATQFEQLAKQQDRVPDREELALLSVALDQTLSALEREMEETGQPPADVEALPSAPMLKASAEPIENDLCRSIERQELDVEYQPFVDRSGRSVLGVEALLRWSRNGVDRVPPSLFVPIAEQTGFIHDIGDWVLRRACQDAVAWPQLTVAVNVSPVQFRRPELADHFEKILSESAIDPRRIEFEITETTFLEDERMVLQTIERLKRRGASLALDDFGTGYASLTCLRSFPFDTIKIDRSFVGNIGLMLDATIVHAVASIARALGLKVVAEGVETAEQRQFLTTAGVHAMQGYLFARPMRHADIAAFVAEFEGRNRASA